MKPRTPILAIIGRPNVGKSTLFNRIVGARRAVVEDIPGVTRDRNYALVERFEIPFFLVDTGGFEKAPEGVLGNVVVEQVRVAVEEADVILGIFDAQSGCQPGDFDVIELLRRCDKPVLYVANKCDSETHEALGADFYQLGISRVYTCSAAHGRGVEEFLDDALMRLPDFKELSAWAQAEEEREKHAIDEAEHLGRQGLAFEDEFQSEGESKERDTGDDADEVIEPHFAPVFVPGESEESADEYLRSHRVLRVEDSLPVRRARTPEDVFEFEEAIRPGTPPPDISCIRLALVGRPNVGKSTLFNALFGEERAITSPVAGTTRDTLYVSIEHEGQKFELMDTAGLKKQGRIVDTIEKYSVFRALGALANCDVAVVLIDAEQGPTEQDGKIVGFAHEQGKGLLLVVNKWDLIEKHQRIVQEFKQKMQDAFKFTPYAPLIFISAKSGKRCFKVLDEVRRIGVERSKMVPTGPLNRLLKEAAKKVSAPSYRGMPVKLYYAAQIDCAPPRFVFFFNHPKHVHFSYLRFLKNTIRSEFGFDGSDIKIVTRKR